MALGFKPTRKYHAGKTFGTLYHYELSMSYDALTSQKKTDKLVGTLQQMQEAGLKTVVFSAHWDWTEPADNQTRYEYINWLMDAACMNTRLKVNLVLNVMNPPSWIWDRYPDARAVDADGRAYSHISWFHPLSGEAARRHLEAVSSHLARRYPDCAVAMQPVYNNAYEAKFTQEHDSYQDYSPYALAAFQNWLRHKSPSHMFFNARWGTDFKSWEEVMPPSLHSGDVSGVDFSARYWDFLKFREDIGANILDAACSAIRHGGLKCFHRFSELFTVLDAIYGASMFKRIAASRYTDFVIIASNFRTPYGTPMNANELRVNVAAAASYGKPVYFEAAVEQLSSLEALEAGFRNSMLAGGENLGITNWHTRLEMNASLAAAMRPKLDPACKPCELVGLFLHLDSCSAFHGLQWQWARKDPLHDFVEDIADRVAGDCGTDVAVYIELDRFLADIPKFTRAVFVEPLVLYDSKERESYIAAKSALQRIPHELFSLPINVTNGPSMVVFQDFPGA
ncbi:hypothetical protein GPECTOR_5g163 [Gonium pectorale]|uniref:Glycoside hydrolase family 42 N-terminal domain-containing protein n=1 Tax=Gonium pectorale TaxID=33097 RepID=A0A150GW90_GONPE|nr:hypothetical protein GPECTOR_5g163 [Gonium pectorale]|eukprot:KXZ54055.1 hypothetical protein GPECTOR_5g163 [Gonium pectorale]